MQFQSLINTIITLISIIINTIIDLKLIRVSVRVLIFYFSIKENDVSDRFLSCLKNIT